MIGLSSIAVAFLFGAGVYLMLARDVQRLVIGFIVLSNGVNLLVLTAAGLPEDAVPPLLPAPGAMADPLAQAFLLTAIVIGLAMAAFLLAMAARFHRETGSDELDGGGE